MDNTNQLMQELHHQLEHMVDHSINSPMVVNRAVGEAMRHIGAMLEGQSSAYLPFRNEEILVPPEKFHPTLNDAVVFARRSITASNTFTLLVNRKTINEEEITYDLFAFRVDNFDLIKTQFMVLGEAMQKEIIRQLALIVESDGNIVLQCVVLKDYFDKKESTIVDDLFNSDTGASIKESVEKPVSVQTTSMLPPVDSTLL